MNRYRLLAAMAAVSLAMSGTAPSVAGPAAGQPAASAKADKESAAALEREARVAEARINASPKLTEQVIAATRAKDTVKLRSLLMSAGMSAKSLESAKLVAAPGADGNTRGRKIRITVSCSWPPLSCTITIGFK